MERFDDFCRGIRNVKKNLYLLFHLGKPSKLFDATNPDWVPTLKLGHDKLAINASEATNCSLFTIKGKKHEEN